MRSKMTIINHDQTSSFTLRILSFPPLVILTCISLILLYETVALAIELVTPIYNVNDFVNIRAEPSKKSSKISELRPGQAAFLIGSLPEWFEIELADGTRGFISRDWSISIEVPQKAKSQTSPQTGTPEAVALKGLSKSVEEMKEVVEAEVSAIKNEMKPKLYDDVPVVISAIAAIFAVGIAFWTVRIHIKNSKEDKFNRRAYVVAIGSSINNIGGQVMYRTTLRNDGRNPASDIEINLDIFGIENKVVTTHIKFPLSNANKLPPNIALPWEGRIKKLEEFENFPFSYIRLKIDYKDDILKHSFPELFYYKWGGIEQRNPKQPQLEFVSKDEKNEINDMIDKNYVPFLVG